MNITTNFPYFSKIFLEFISKYATFKNEFKNFAKEIEDDIESASNNPTCQCRGKIEQYVFKNKEVSFNFLIKYCAENNIDLNFEASIVEEKYKINDYSGKVEKIKISEWSQLSEKIRKERAIYRNFSVVSIDSEYVNVFFL